jgi:hypothetical protein
VSERNTDRWRIEHPLKPSSPVPESEGIGGLVLTVLWLAFVLLWRLIRLFIAPRPGGGGPPGQA